MLLRRDNSDEHKLNQMPIEIGFDAFEVARILAIPQPKGMTMTTSMNELFDRYVAECMDELMPRTKRDYLGILVSLRSQFGHMDPHDIKPRHVAAFLNVKKGRVHRNRMVMLLSMIFYKAIGKWCISDELHNPCQSVERWPTRPRDRYVTDEEFNKCRAIACPQVQIAMDLALLTGQRQSDIVGLKWKQIKAIGVPRADWRIEITQGKTGKKLAIMISPAIETVLKRAKLMPPEYPREYVIRTNRRVGDCYKNRNWEKTGQPYTSDGFRALWQRTQKKYMSLGNAGWHFHDIRAKSISDNKNLDAAYLLAGHMDVKMTRRVYDRAMRRVEPLR